MLFALSVASVSGPLWNQPVVAEASDVKEYSFELKVEAEEDVDVKKSVDQIVKDMECYLYWTNGEITYRHYHQQDDPACYIAFEFGPKVEITKSEDGIYTDRNGNFSTGEVKDRADVLNTLREMKNLIGYKENKVYEVVNITTDSFGNNYYHFSEKINDSFLENYPQIVVGVDAAGKVSCIAAPSYSQIGDREYAAITSDEIYEAYGPSHEYFFDESIQ